MSKRKSRSGTTERQDRDDADATPATYPPAPTPATSSCYAVARWQEHFENNRSRELKALSWLPLPVLVGTDRYEELMDDPAGAIHLGIFTAASMIAARSRPRGFLLRDNGEPHDAKTFARLARVPHGVAEPALDRLVEVGFLERVPTPPQDGAGFPQDGAATSQEGALENRTEQKTTLQNTTPHNPTGSKSIEEKTSSQAPHSRAADDVAAALVKEFKMTGLGGGDRRTLATLIEFHGIDAVRRTLPKAITNAATHKTAVSYLGTCLTTEKAEDDRLRESFARVRAKVEAETK
jgi:hypothetical protein